MMMIKPVNVNVGVDGTVNIDGELDGCDLRSILVAISTKCSEVSHVFLTTFPIGIEDLTIPKAQLMGGANGRAAPGPSGYTADIMRPLLDDAAGVKALAELLARADSLGGLSTRLVARTLARQFAPTFEAATNPHQYALSTRAGSEALVHSLQAACEGDPSFTVLSVDGVGAFDLIGRQAMLTALRDTPDANAILPFVRLFYGSPSEFAEGGEQGDPLMPALFALGVAPALRAVQADLLPHESVRAFLDDTYLTSQPCRTAFLLQRLEHHLFAHAHIQLNAAKTRVWNAAGIRPAGLPLPPHPAPDHVPIWVGDTGLPAYQQGLKVLGTPLGTDEFVAAQLHTLSAQHRPLLELLPTLPDLQDAWLLLLYCANPRAQYIPRAGPPALTAVFAAEHDRSVLHCLALLLQVHAAPDDPLRGLATRPAHLPLRHGGLGLRSAAAHAPAAFFASWADSLRAIRARASDFCDHTLQQLADPACNIRFLASLRGAAIVLTNFGLTVPAWGEVLAEPPPEAEADPALREPADLATTLSLQISPQCLMRRALHCSTPRAVPLPAVCTPPSPRARSCALIQRLIGSITGQPARVLDSSAVEAFPWSGPRHASGRPRRHQRNAVGAALRIARANKERTYPELLRAPRCRLVVLAIELAGRWSAEAVQFVRLLSRCRARSAPPQMRASSTAAWVQRWSGFLAFAAARSFAASLLSLPLHGAANVDGSPPDLSDVLAERRLDSPPHPSRLPAR
eukprot:s3397_g9.t1